jgi:nucleoside-diphosphate-sugar epimerase
MYDEITVRGTGRLLRALHQLQVEQLVFSSTMLAHAPSKPGERINEHSPLEPKWDYPRSKVATEALIRRERGDIRAVSLRIAGVYDDECHSIPLANQIQRIFERKLTGKLFPGDISRGQSFVHLEDVTEAIIKTVERRHQLDPDTTLLIGEPETLSYDQLQRAFARLVRPEGTLPVIFEVIEPVGSLDKGGTATGSCHCQVHAIGRSAESDLLRRLCSRVARLDGTRRTGGTIKVSCPLADDAVESVPATRNRPDKPVRCGRVIDRAPCCANPARQRGV